MDCSARRMAVPPMWNVRSVSCVPGSPMDCAAMTPTASPTFTMLRGRQVAAVARAADPAPRLTGEHGADDHALETALVVQALDLRGLRPRSGAGRLRRIDLVVQRIDHVFRQHAPEHAVTDRLDDLLGVLQRTSCRCP